MSQPITDYQSFFSGALQAIEDTANLKQEEDQLRSEEARTRTELEAEEKKLKADIDRSIKERLNEINRTYDGEISKAKDELKKAQAKREKARNQSVKARIAEAASSTCPPLPPRGFTIPCSCPTGSRISCCSYF